MGSKPETEAPFLVTLDGPGEPPTVMMLPARLRPLQKRLWSTLKAAWKFWIPPTDRTDHEEHNALRSPLFAWKIAWGIHNDDMEPWTDKGIREMTK